MSRAISWSWPYDSSTGVGCRRARRSTVTTARRLGRRLAEPVMTASGTAGHGAELARYVDLRARRGRGEVAVGRAVGRATRRRGCTRRRRGMLNSVGLQGPGVEAWLATSCRRCSAPAPRVVASIWGRTVEDYAAAAERPGRARRPRWSPSRSTCPVRTSTTARPMFAQLAPTTPPRRSRAVAAACGRPCGPSSAANVTDLVPIADGRARAPGPRRSRSSTPCWAWRSTSTTRRPSPRRRAAGGLSGPAIHPVAVRAVHDVHRRCPICRSSGSAGSPTGPTPSSCCWPARRRCRWARRPSPIPALRPGARPSSSTGARRTACATVTELIGDAHEPLTLAAAVPPRTIAQPSCARCAASTSTTWSRPCAWPASCGRGSAWPRSASSSTARPAPTPSSSLIDAGLRRVRRPQAARHPDHGAASVGRVLGSLGARYLTLHARGDVRRCCAPGSRASARAPTRAGLPEPDRAGGHRAHQRRRRAAAHPAAPGRAGRRDAAAAASCARRPTCARPARSRRGCCAVVPGIRPGRQRRPRPGPRGHAREALDAGADLLVIGRAVTQADDPAAAAAAVVGRAGLTRAASRAA